MNTELLKKIPEDFANESRLWLYQSSRPFSEKEELEINEQLLQFYSQWLSHGELVKGWAKLLYKQFIVVMADETGTNVGGCSTDGMFRIIKSLENQYKVNFFDRMMVTFLINEKAQMLPFDQVQYAIDKGYITKDTLLFNNIVNTKEELLHNWLVPLEKSWLAERVSLPEIK
jgi:hypothetical protein